MRKQSSGFSFIEILFLMGICTLMVVIVLPVYSTAKMRGRRTECLSNLRQIGMAAQLYAQDYDGLLPPWYNRRNGGDPELSEWNDPDKLYRALEYKVGTGKLLFCASDDYAGRDVEAFGINHLYSSYHFNFKPPGSGGGQLTINGLMRGTRIVVETSDYPVARDANTGPETGPYIHRVHRHCQHFRGVNVLYLDGHARWRPWDQVRDP